MYKQSGSRNSRTRGIRVKRVLQISLLLGICFWLIYQVKHSHDKKKIHESDAKISADERIGIDILNHGRKELRPLVDEVTAVNEKHEEEEEEEEKDEELPNDKLAIENENYKEETEEEENEDNKHNEDEEEHEEGEEEESKRAGKELEEEESNSDDDSETNRDDDQVDAEKATDDDDSEGNESEDKEGRAENDDSGQNSHEAREELYKGDDASSAVAHHEAETENLSLVNSGESESESSWQENKSGNTTETNGVPQNNSMPGHDKFSEPEESFHQNSTELNEQVSANNGTTQVSTEGSNNSTIENTVSELAGQNGTETVSVIKLQNATDDSSTEEDKTLQITELEHGNNQSDSNSTVPSVSENITRSNSTAEDESSSESNSNEKETGEGNGNSESDNTGEGNGSSESENTDAAHHISLDSSMAQDVENRIDLDVLPEFKTEGDSNDEDAASE